MWGIAVPSRPSRLPGVQMAGFVGDTVDLVDLTVVPYPAVTLFLNLRERLLVNDVARGSVVAGLAPQGMRVRGQDIECMQIRLSPEVAHAVLGTELSEVVSLEDVWPTDLPDRLRALNSWKDRFALVEASLARRYEVGRTVDPEVAFAWQQLDARHGQVRIEQLADETGWSRKRLWSGASSGSARNVPRNWSDSTTRCTGSPLAKARRRWRPTADTSTSRTCTTRSKPSPGSRPRPPRTHRGSRSTKSPGLAPTARTGDRTGMIAE